MDFLIKEKAAAIVVPEKKLQVVIFPDNDHYTAYCPQFDLATSQPSPHEVLEDIILAIREYVEDFMANFDTYSKSPNRAHHSLLARELVAVGGEWEIRELIEVRYGELYVRPVQKSA